MNDWTLNSPLVGDRLARLLALKAALFKQGLVVPLTAKKALAEAEAAIKAGATVLEVYLRAGSEESCDADIAEALEAIQQLKTRHSEVFIGAGSADTPQLAALAIDAGADFIVSQGYVPETVEICAAHCVLPILGCSTPAEVSQLAEQMRRLFRFEVTDDQLGKLEISRVQANAHIVKFFVATGRMAEFDGMAQTYGGKGIRFMIAGGVKSDSGSIVATAVDPAALQKQETVAGWSTRKLVVAVTSSEMMKGDVEQGVKLALASVEIGRHNSKA